ncbi:PEP-CTERM sorting domain-containing protein [Paludisphaera soli]|uniref:PEP-CTERM sorting domain-containing protein n=1 Tax=Paludisphaera soli TaxID=2712865 RepID=UPI0013EC95D1|nr:PEP-CTERM sorting domain-containing protein [Paludisphaera soli]
MDANGATWNIRARRRGGAAFAAIFLVHSAATAEAAPIRWSPRPRVAAQQLGAASVRTAPNAWASFLSGGESTWASRPSPPFTTAVRQAVLRLVNGDPSIAASSPLIEYMLWRRNLDVARFDFYHPFVGPRLPQGLIPPVPQVVPPLTPPVDVPSIPVDPPLLPPVPSVIPPVVPEPSAFLVIALGAAGAIGMRRLRERASSR